MCVQETHSSILCMLKSIPTRVQVDSNLFFYPDKSHCRTWLFSSIRIRIDSRSKCIYHKHVSPSKGRSHGSRLCPDKPVTCGLPRNNLPNLFASRCPLTAETRPTHDPRTDGRTDVSQTLESYVGVGSLLCVLCPLSFLFLSEAAERCTDHGRMYYRLRGPHVVGR